MFGGCLPVATTVNELTKPGSDPRDKRFRWFY
jgi:hypothetical protein